MLNPDLFFDELSWTISGNENNYNSNVSNSSLTFLSTGDDYETMDMNATHWVEDGCYIFTIYDSYGDGMSLTTDPFNGWFELFVNNVPITFGKQSFYGSSVSIHFCTVETDLIDNNNNNTIANDTYPHSLSIQISGCSQLVGNSTIAVIRHNNNSNNSHTNFSNYLNGTIDNNSSNTTNDTSIVYYYLNEYHSSSESEISERMDLTIDQGCYTVSFWDGSIAYYSISIDNDETNTCIGYTNSTTPNEFTFGAIVCTPNAYFNYDLDGPMCNDADVRVDLPYDGTNSQIYYFQCTDLPCLISRTFEINQTCSKPQLSWRMVDTNLISNQTGIYLNGGNFRHCNWNSTFEINNNGGDVVIECLLDEKTETLLDLSNYTSNSLTTMVVTVSVEEQEKNRNINPYEGLYSLYSGVVMSCQDAIADPTKCINGSNLTVNIKYDDDPMSFYWHVLNDDDEYVLTDGLQSFYSDYQFQSFERCFSQDDGIFSLSDKGCLAFIMEGGYGQSSTPGWVQILWNGEKITFDNSQTFIENRINIEFCPDDLLLDHSDNSSTLKIGLNYDTRIEIVNINISHSDKIYGNDIRVYSNNDNDATMKYWEIPLRSGCYDILLKDVDTEDEQGLAHGKYNFSMNGDIVALGGYYEKEEEVEFCTSETDITRCKFKPGLCVNATVTVPDDDKYDAISYKTFTNCIFENEKSEGLKCSGVLSCYQMANLTLKTKVTSAFGMIESFDNADRYANSLLVIIVYIVL